MGKHNKMSDTKIFEIEIKSLAFGGAAVGRLPDGKVCFVHGAIPGETVKVEIVSEKKNFAKGRLVSIEKSSPERIDCVCPLATDLECPSCSYQHMTYAKEIEWKERQLKDFLFRKGRADESLLEPSLPSPARFNTRNRLKLACVKNQDGKMITAYRSWDNITPVEVKTCHLARKVINDTLSKISIPVTIDSLYMRWTLADGITTNLDKNFDRKILTEQLGPLGSFRVSAQSFFQTNTAVAEKLVSYVSESLSECDITELVELYSGVGVFSICAAKRNIHLKCTGIEIDSNAVKSAKINALSHNVSDRCNFVSGDAGKSLQEVSGKLNPAKSALLADPPRNGLDDKTVKEIIKFSPGYIIIVSCSPDTLARDLEKFYDADYIMTSAKLFDMFPCTGHFETCIILKRKEK